jgi:hypothetical protein
MGSNCVARNVGKATDFGEIVVVVLNEEGLATCKDNAGTTANIISFKYFECALSFTDIINDKIVIPRQKRNELFACAASSMILFVTNNSTLGSKP